MFGLTSPILLTTIESIPLDFRSDAVPSVAMKVYPTRFISFAISKNSSLSWSFTVARTTPLSLDIFLPAAVNPLYNASSNVSPTPKTSPVDFISGPRLTSTLASFDIENTGTFTAINSGVL